MLPDLTRNLTARLPLGERGTAFGLRVLAGRNKNELSFEKGALFTLIKESSRDWFKVQAADGKFGYVPANYVRRRKATIEAMAESSRS